MSNYLQLAADACTEVTRERDETDEWDADDTSTSWNVSGVLLLAADAYQAIKPSFPVADGDKVWVVYAIYSTGDSFSHSESGSLEFIDAFLSRDKAKAAAESLQAPGESGQWVREDGSTAKMGWKPWEGYFESLADMRVEQHEVRA